MAVSVALYKAAVPQRWDLPAYVPFCSLTPALCWLCVCSRSSFFVCTYMLFEHETSLIEDYYFLYRWTGLREFT